MSATLERRRGSMKIILATLLPGDTGFVRTNVHQIALRPDGNKGKTTTWMDRVAAEKIVMQAQVDGAKLVVLGREAARAFHFREVGSLHQVSIPKEGKVYDTPTSGSLPPIPIVWTSLAAVEPFLE